VRNRIFFKLLAAFALVVLVTAFTLDTSIRRAWETSLRDEIQRNLTQKTLLLAHRVEIDRQHSLQDIITQEGQAAGARATVIDPTGKVLADSEADPASMENHAQSKELKAALAGNIGVDERRSRTIGIPFLYVAAPVSGGAVRLAYPLSDVESSSQRVHRALLRGSLVAFVIVMIAAAMAAQYTARRLQRIVKFAERIAAGDLTARIAARSVDEIGQVAVALDKTARKLEQSFVAVQTSQHQLETLLNSMRDAVIAVGADGRVQWANRGMDRLVPQHARLNAPVVGSAPQARAASPACRASAGQAAAGPPPGERPAGGQPSGGWPEGSRWCAGGW